MTKWQKWEYLGILLAVSATFWTQKIEFEAWEIPALGVYSLVLMPGVLFLSGFRFRQRGKLYLIVPALFGFVLAFSSCFWGTYRLHQWRSRCLLYDPLGGQSIYRWGWKYLAGNLPHLAVGFTVPAVVFLLGYAFAKWREKKRKIVEG